MEPLFECRTEVYTPHVAPRPPLVVLPSGCVVNLEQVAFVSTPVDGMARIYFIGDSDPALVGVADHAALIDAIAPMEDEDDDDAG